MKAQKLLAVTLLICSLAAPGCGSSEVAKPTEQQNVFASIEGLGDLAADEERFASAFVSGSAPKNRKDYEQLGYQVNGEATFEGDSVTVPVKVFGGVHASSTGDTRGGKASSAAESEHVWTLQRVGEQWKLKDAPIS